MKTEGKSFYIMFDVIEGGMLEAIELAPSNLQDNKSIILLDEENRTVWLWHGKLRGLVKRRTALRQAQSLKGHGYQTGNAIVGRDLRYIREIDARKVGRVDEDTEANNEFTALLENSFENNGNFTYTMSSGGAKKKASLKTEPAPEPKKKPKETPKPKIEEVKGPEPKIERKYPLKHVEVEKRKPDMHTPERKFDLKPIKLPPDKKKEPSTATTPEETEESKGEKGLLHPAAVIMSVLEHYKDIWISKKDNGIFNIEQMDGKICSFNVNKGEIEYQPGSFKEIPEDKKKAILSKVQDFL